MPSKAQFLWRCHECKGNFRLTKAEALHAAGAKCSLCGSRFVERVVGAATDQDTNVMAVRTRTRHKNMPVDELHFPNGKRDSIRRHFKAARVNKLLSQPGRYREVALRNNHERYLIAKKKAENRRRIEDFTVFTDGPDPETSTTSET